MNGWSAANRSCPKKSGMYQIAFTFPEDTKLYVSAAPYDVDYGWCLVGRSNPILKYWKPLDEPPVGV